MTPNLSRHPNQTIDQISPSWTIFRPKGADFFQLTKPRLTSLILLTMIAGYYLGSRGNLFSLLFFHALIGTALTVGGASAINMFLERHLDRLMERTKNRPIPAARLLPVDALVFSIGISLFGLIYLALLVNLLTAFLSALSAAVYLFIYTPLKMRSPLCTYVGTIPGAIPPMLGWAAATNHLSREAWILYAILTFWQMPHFLAIGSLYRDEYAKAGFKVLPAVDAEGRRTKRQMLLFCMGLIPVSLISTWYEFTGPFYSAVALYMGTIYLFSAVLFAVFPERIYAKRIFVISLIYLPMVLLAMVIDRVHLGGGF
ncbi:MAG: protoheme IX farnesyltransferase [Deltaproteobacteria bacterium]|nr:protoheme IX farnesyltransferase [Deltaproteobacteria bacterium]